MEGEVGLRKMTTKTTLKGIKHVQCLRNRIVDKQFVKEQYAMSRRKLKTNDHVRVPVYSLSLIDLSMHLFHLRSSGHAGF